MRTSPDAGSDPASDLFAGQVDEVHLLRCAAGRPTGERADRRLANGGLAGHAQVPHGLQDPVASRLDGAGEAAEEGPVGGLNRRGQQGGFVEAHLRQVCAQKVSRGCSDAIDGDTPVMPHIHGIQIGFHNLTLGVLGLEHEGGAGLPELSPPCPVVAEVEHPGELLRDRAPPLANPSPPQVRHGGAQHGPHVDPRMAKESPILRRQDGMDDRLRNLAQGNPDLRAPIGPLQRRDFCATGVKVDCRMALFAKVQQRIGPPGPD
jgi:hypothetical protein